MTDKTEMTGDDALLAACFDQAAEAFCLIRPDGALHRVNPAFEALLGADPSVRGDPCLFASVQPGDVDAARAHLSTIAETGEADPAELRFRRDDGSVLWLRVTARPLPGSTLLFAQLRDVTEERRMAAHGPAIETMTGIGTWEVDCATNSVYWSATTYRVYGLDPANGPADRQAALDHYRPEARAKVMAAYSRMLEDGEPYDLEVPFVSATGCNRWVRVSAASEWRDGELLRVFGTIEDVTEKRARRKHLRRLVAVVENTEHGVILADVAGRIEWVNPAFTDITGYSLDEVRGYSPSAVLDHPDTDPEICNRAWAAVARGEATRFEVMHRAKDGSDLWIDMELRPISRADGSLEACVALQTDITERKSQDARLKQAEAEARTARERLVTGIEALPDGFVLYDGDDRLVICNERYRQTYAISAPAMVEGATFEEILRYGLERGQYAAGIGREEAWLEERLAAHRTIGKTVEQQLSDGRWLRILERETAEGGRVGVRVDVTEQIESRSRAEQAERRLYDAINALPVAFWLFDADGRLALFNEYYAQLYERSAPALQLGVTYWEVVQYGLEQGEYPLAVGREEEWLDELYSLRAGGAYSTEYPLANGCWIKSFNEPTSDGGIVGFRLDITEIKRREADLMAALAERDAAKQRFFDIAAVSTDWFWEHGPDNRFTFISQSFARTTGGNCEMHIGRTRDELMADYPATRESADWDWFEAQIAAREPFSDFVYLAFGFDSREVWVRVSGAPFYDADGAYAGYRGVGSDVTALYSAMKRAEEANVAKSAFLANMSHEIRTPMNGLLGTAEILESSVVEPEQKRLVGTIRESGEVLMHILNDILDVSKIEAGKLDLSLVEFRAADLVHRIEALHSGRASEKGLSLVVLSGREAEVARLGDAHRIMQVLNNLVSNAIKFTEEGEVTISVRGDPDGALTIDVQDTGIGMSEEQLGRVFEEFAQGDTSTTRRFGGTGLGLAIVRKLVDAMSGDIRVRSRSDAGTRVRVRLPLTLAEAPGERAADTAEQAEEPGLPPGLRVLVADDNRTNRMVLEALLRSLDVEAHVVESGEAAIRAAEEPWDLYLLDISMPGLDGIQTLAALREREWEASRPRTPALAVTANAMRHQVALYLQKGFDGHIAKPVRTVELRAHIVECLASHAAAPPVPAPRAAGVAG